MIDEQQQTLRELERRREDWEAMPVILKRVDTTGRRPEDMLEKAIEKGERQLNRPPISLYLSAVSAGLLLGFSVIAVSFAKTIAPPEWGPHFMRFAMAIVYPLGFIFCIMSGSELFTEHTALAAYPCLDGRQGLGKLLQLWAIVLVGNLCGTLLSSILIILSEPVTKTSEGYSLIAGALTSGESIPIFFSAILAGWLMAVANWLTLSGSSMTGKIILVYLVTFMIGIGGFHHSIVGSAELFVGSYYNDAISFKDIVKFLSIAITGNLIGGSILVALLNYTQIKETQKIKAERH